MKDTTPPRLAQALLHHFTKGRYRESLEGDLLEEFCAGRSSGWYWRQVICALKEHAFVIARQRVATFALASVFFVAALAILAPLTDPLMHWAQASGLNAGAAPTGAGAIGLLYSLAWLAGVPFVLGGVAEATERQRRAGTIILAAAVAYLTPVTLLLDPAVCELCATPANTPIPDVATFLLPAASALLAGFGAFSMGRLLPREKVV
jgi:hypothetical protein